MSELRRYPDYKDSGVPWLGDIPSHWEAKRMRFFVNTNPLKSELGIQEGLLVSFVPMESVAVDGGLTLTTNKEISDVYKGYTYFRNNDVVMAKITPCFENGKASICNNLTNDIGFGTTELHVLRPKEETSSRFLFYLIRSDVFMKIGESEMYGAGGQKRVPESFIKNFVAPLPDIDEQQAIVNFLDDKLNHIDTLISKQQQLIEKLSEQRSAVITHAVTKGLDPDVPMKDSGIEWLGDIPEHWDIKRIRFLFDFKNNIRVPVSAETRSYIQDRIYPYYGASGIIDYVDSYLFEEDLILVAEDGANLLSRSTPLAFIARGKYWVNNHAHIIKPLDENIDYWQLVLASYDFTPIVSGSAQPKLTKDNLASIKLPVPPISEINQIFDNLKPKIKLIDKQSKKMKLVIAKLQEYRAALITQAVTGKIDVRHINKKAS